MIACGLASVLVAGCGLRRETARLRTPNSPSSPAPAPLPYTSYKISGSGPQTAATPPKSDDPEFDAIHGVQMGELLVPATLSGRKFFCAVDTGSDSVFWPAYFRLKGRYTGHFEPTWHLNAHNESQYVTLPEVKIGRTTWTNVTTLAETVEPEGPVPAPDEIAFREGQVYYPELGGPLFLNKIITIDLAETQLTLHGPRADLIPALRHKGDIVLPLEIGKGATPLSYPVFDCTIGGRKTRLVFDSGMNLPAISLANWFVDSDPTLQKIAIRWPTGPRQRYIKRMTYAFGGLPAHTAEALTPPDDQDWLRAANIAGYVGFDILRKYRVTIDYPRKKMLLQPYTTAQRREIPLGRPLGSGVTTER